MKIAHRHFVTSAGKKLVQAMFVTAIAAGAAACGGAVVKHGHVFGEEDLQQVKPGMSKDQVALALGTPDTKATSGDDVYYYISTTTKKSMAFMKPKITDRQVVAVYFDKKDSVQRVANYGLQDGKVVDFVTRQTPSYGGEEGLIKSIFRNIGKAQPTVPGPGGTSGGGGGGY
ncbi:MAG: outer membrane protein assembly factor BamE [Chitinophagales bacterium]|nr:outer membrane protein assembly factor BamE [Hyphomicrobiales bacterium]